LGFAATLLGDEKLENLEISIIRQIRGVLAQIVDDFPSSDIAVRILFQDEIEALDVAELDRRIGDDLLESSSSEVVSSRACGQSS